jgi:hypothetical protein
MVVQEYTIPANEDLTTLLFSVGKGDGNTRVESGSLLIGGNTAWHAGNDGAGSGLDADLLDGLQLHTGRNNEANKVVRTNGSGYLDVGWINTTSGDLGVATRLDRVYCSNDAYVRYLGLTDFKNQMGLSSKNNYSRRVDYTADSNYWVGSFGHVVMAQMKPSMVDLDSLIFGLVQTIQVVLLIFMELICSTILLIVLVVLVEMHMVGRWPLNTIVMLALIGEDVMLDLLVHGERYGTIVMMVLEVV